MKKLVVFIFALSLTSCWFSFEKKVSWDETISSLSLDSLNNPNEDSVVIKTEYIINGFHKTEYKTYKKFHNGDINSAFYDDDVDGRKQALTLLTDESSIQHVAFFDEDVEVRKLAVTMLKDESNIQHVAYFDEDVNVRKLAVTFLKEQSSIQHVAFFDKDVNVRKLALQMLTALADIKHVATFDENSELREMATRLVRKRFKE